MSINMRKVLSFLLVAAMLVSCIAILGACNDKKDDGKKDDQTGKGEYTYNTYLSTFPSGWNNHTYQTATDSEIIGYTEPGFFTFDYNETKDGYQVVPEMATKLPEDVTSEYVGQFGIEEGDASKAWKLTIHNNVKWEDGTLITANDFVESMKLLLNPDADNYRADGVYNGNMVLVGAKDYFYQGEYVFDSIYPNYVAEFGKAEDGQYKVGDNLVWVNVALSSDWSSNALAAYFKAGYMQSEDAVNAYNLILGKADKEKEDYTPVTDEIKDALLLLTAHLHGYVTKDAEGNVTGTDVAAYQAAKGDYAAQEWQEFCKQGYNAAAVNWDTVGIKALSDTELVIFLERPLKGFYLLYSLTGNLNLVNVDLYKKCMSVDENGIYNCTYGTSVDTYMSYGPYKLTAFQLDKEILLEKNDQWYGYTLDTNKGWYQTSKIHYDYIKENETAMLAFLQGKLDSKGLDATYMDEYSKSEHIYYTDGASTFFVAMNPDLDALAAEQAKKENINKTILTIKEFRMAMSFALDRAAFNLACDPTASAGFGLYNNLIISDPENGTAYRTTEQAKKVLAQFWGVADQYGEGKTYATIDEAIASITGYNPEEGKRLFQAAYDKAVEAGLIDADDVVEITVGIPSQHTFYSNGYEFLVNCYTEAVKGTSLEGRLTFNKDDTIGNAFSDALKSNQVNLLFGVGWTGSALDPYNLMEAYTSEDYQYDPAWNTKVETLTITLDDGKAYTATVWDWTLAMMGETIQIADAEGNKKDYSCGLNDNKPEERLEILAAIEGAVLSTYDLLPLQNQSSAALKGMQIKYYTEEYVYGVGRGGIKYMTYNMDDYEWNKFVAKQGGELNYK